MSENPEASAPPTPQRWTKTISTPGLLPSLIVLVAGASAGFFAWTFTVTKTTLHSYIFFNNLAVAERTRLILLIAAGALLFFTAWNLLAFALSRNHRRRSLTLDRSAVFFSTGALLGFWPFLSVQAIEVFYTF
ncbi:MAG: hypothetical protein KAS61_05695, partial [Spirochaetes bacterium]|nr:hypothetical protein [Spirochaetota bacterium]